jgi:beta-hydroxylase
VQCVWRDGEAFMFDETFIHSAENATTSTASSCSADIERPMKYGFMTAINRWVSHHIVKASATQNMEGEHVGVLNKVFGKLYEVTWPAARSRSGTARSTTTLKYSLMIGIVGLIRGSALR